MSVSWTCPQCGLDYDTILPKDAVAAFRSYARRYGELFPARDDDEKPDGVIRRRPEPDVWSMLEYAAHVGDVEDELAGYLRRIQVEDRPTFERGFDNNQRATEQRYNEQPRAQVLEHLNAAFDNIASVVESAPNDAWGRTGTFSFGERDLLDMTRNAVHEGYHHLRDIEDVLKRVVGR